MAKYSDIVAGLAVGVYGSAGPAGFTSRFVTSGALFDVSADASAPSGKAVNITSTGTGRTLFSFDAINSDADRATSTSIALIRISSTPAGAAATFGGIASRGNGSAGSETLTTALLGRSGSGNARFLTNTYTNGSNVTTYALASNVWVPGGLYWLKHVVSGSSSIAYIYAENDLNGTAITSVSTTPPASNANNWHGIFLFSIEADFDVLYYAIGTGSDLPDPPGGVAEPVLTLPTGATTGATTASGSVTTDTASGTLYAVVTTSATPPAAADIKTGVGAAYSTSQTVTATGIQNVAATGLTGATTYYWHFVHNNSNVITSNSFTTDATVTAPATAPTGLTATAQSDTVIRSTWNALAGATGYKIRRDGVTVVDVGNVVTYDATGLTASTQYGFEVLAYNTAGDGPYSVQVLETTQAAPQNITLVTDFDAANVSQTLSTIVNPESASPRLNIEFRPEMTTGVNGTGWNIALFAVENASGKTPTFAINRNTMFNKTFAFSASYLPSYTQDFVTFVQASSTTLVGGSTGTIEFQFANPLPAGRVYVMTNPMGQQGDAAPFAAALLADNPAVVTPLPSANASGVFFTSPAEVDENGRQVGGHGMYAFKFAFGGSTTDGGPKRKLLMTAGIHAMGEQHSWISFKSFINYMLNSAEADAVRLRADFDVYCYFNITPNGIFSGHRRHNPSRSVDPNRDFVNKALSEISALTTAIVADTGGNVDVSFGWHGYAHTQNNFVVLAPSSANTTRFIELGTVVFGGAPLYEDFNTVGSMPNWANANLSSKFSCEVEVQGRGDTSLANYQNIGRNWAKTLAAADADGMFVKSANISATMPQFAVDISADNQLAAVDATVAFAMPQFTVAINADNELPGVSATASFTMPQFTAAVSAESAAPTSGATISFGMPQFIASASGENTAPVFAADASFAMPQFTVAATGESFISGNVATVEFAMPQFSASASASITVPEIAASAAFAMPQFTVSVFSGEFDYFQSAGTTITYIAESTEITYTI